MKLKTSIATSCTEATIIGTELSISLSESILENIRQWAKGNRDYITNNFSDYIVENKIADEIFYEGLSLAKHILRSVISSAEIQVNRSYLEDETGVYIPVEEMSKEEKVKFMEKFYNILYGDIEFVMYDNPQVTLSNVHADIKQRYGKFLHGYADDDFYSKGFSAGINTCLKVIKEKM